MTTSSAGCTLDVEVTAPITVTNAFTAANVNMVIDGNANGVTLSGP